MPIELTGLSIVLLICQVTKLITMIINQNKLIKLRCLFVRNFKFFNILGFVLFGGSMIILVVYLLEIVFNMNDHSYESFIVENSIIFYPIFIISLTLGALFILMAGYVFYSNLEMQAFLFMSGILNEELVSNAVKSYNYLGSEAYVKLYLNWIKCISRNSEFKDKPECDDRDGLEGEPKE